MGPTVAALAFQESVTGWTKDAPAAGETSVGAGGTGCGAGVGTGFPPPPPPPLAKTEVIIAITKKI